jgi:hypothetical protein
LRSEVASGVGYGAIGGAASAAFSPVLLKAIDPTGAALDPGQQAVTSVVNGVLSQAQANYGRRTPPFDANPLVQANDGKATREHRAGKTLKIAATLPKTEIAYRHRSFRFSVASPAPGICTTTTNYRPMNSLSHTKRLTLGLSAVMLAGCASLPKTDLNADARSKLHSIAILSVKEPKTEPVMNVGGAAAGFGLVGAMIQAGVNSSHTSTYTKKVATDKVLFAPIVADGVMDRLTADGYQVVKLDGQDVKLASDGKSDDYSGIHTDADAIMNVWISTMGYVSPPESAMFVPWVVVRARILDAKTKQDMYFKTYACGYDIKSNSVHVDSEGTYSYGTFDSLEKNFDQSVTGLQSCEKSIVAAIGKDLARNQ